MDLAAVASLNAPRSLAPPSHHHRRPHRLLFLLSPPGPRFLSLATPNSSSLPLCRTLRFAGSRCSASLYPSPATGDRPSPSSGADIHRESHGDLRVVLLAVATAFACGVFVVRCQRALAADAARFGLPSLKWVLSPKLLQTLNVLKDQGLVLAALLGLSAFFSMAETSITTLWPWKVRELADKEPENGVFRMLSGDITRFLTTILIGTTVANIGATALVTEAATTIFGEAGVSAATGVMTVKSKNFNRD